MSDEITARVAHGLGMHATPDPFWKKVCPLCRGRVTINGLKVGDIVRKGSGVKTYRVTAVHSPLSVALQPADAIGRYFYDADPSRYTITEGK